ncbi:hypothetical protein [Burkholderia sp. Ac-20379]|uniref:hypothetical protein n=1 Tax=Burkholderia sp. Ac-20379 TaxID=2703900 RepID=UPI0019824EFD|nr:hypothetical protein [Burkholderia sp. Ac-20379]MBN3725969.1 hypothetical protein [Burkholderia sp. Ac-20379]
MIRLEKEKITRPVAKPQDVPVATPNPSLNGNATRPADRKIGVPLGLGILFLPFIFVWFLLRKGYGKQARIICFGWMFVCVFLASTNDKPNDASSKQAATHAAAQAEPASAAPVAAPASEAAAPVQAAASRITPESIVTFPKGMVTCVTSESLSDVIALTLAHKATKLASHFKGKNADCVMLNEKRHYKIIDIHPSGTKDWPDAAILEIVGVNVDATSKGAFGLVTDANDDSVVHIVEPG